MYAYTRRGPASASVVARRNLLAAYIDAAAREWCCREYSPWRAATCAKGNARAVLDRNLLRFCALDQDPRALGVVEAEQSQFGVETVRGSVRQIPGNKLSLGKFDVIYSAGFVRLPGG